MKIFIDSAKLSEIEEAYSAGFLDGVTTNPSLLKKAVDDLKEKGEDIDLAGYIEKILTVAKGTPVSLEVTEITYDGMVAQARKIYERFNPVADNVYIKVPVNPIYEGAEVGRFEGLQTIKTLAAEGIPTNCTLIFTPNQHNQLSQYYAQLQTPTSARYAQHRFLSDWRA